MNNNSLAVFCIALASLLLEITLIRVFDVLWYPNMSYIIITLVVFSFGLAGVYLTIFPVVNKQRLWFWLSLASAIMAVISILLLPIIDRLPFDYFKLNSDQASEHAINFFKIYAIVCLPFFLAGFSLSLVFSHYAEQIQKLYFWDLIGASIGAILLIPLLPKIGTTGLLYTVAGFSLLACAFFSYNKIVSSIAIILATISFITPFGWDNIKNFKPHMDKRGFKQLIADREGSYWDPISRIDIMDYESFGKRPGINRDYTFKWIAYDGGTQTSYFYRFDGDFKKIRDGLPDNARQHFWNSYLAISHYLKADSDANVLIIGSAGGQEAKAALTFNAKQVDGVELVGKVVELGKTHYNDYIGGIMNMPNVDIQRGEGRSYLRSSDKKYDIIQINSNHTSSSIAAGSGAMQSAYLQTVEAYKEFFSHLEDDGILHINHHVYPKMVATAAQAWAELGHKDFRQHVMVFESSRGQDNLPTFLVKMSPWTQEEVELTKQFFHAYDFKVNPFAPESSFLSDAFFQPDFPKALADRIPYRIIPPTDDQPFFNSLRKTLDVLPKEDAELFLNESISGLLNSQRNIRIPTDVLHLFVTAGSALFFALFFTMLPLICSKTGRQKWTGKSSVLGYFACLGSGFIILELVFIQIFMKLIGFPLYSYTTVLFTFLIGAGIGSLMSEKLQLVEKGRQNIIFVGIIISTLLLILYQHVLFDHFLQFPVFLRIIIAIIMIFPLAFFLGMPFPLGILALQDKPNGTIAWAWAFNGLFTVIGGITSVIASVYLGFTITIIFAMIIYMIAHILYQHIHQSLHHT